MKKVLFTIIICGAALTGRAQDFGVWEMTHDTHASMARIERKIYHALKNVFSPRPDMAPWVKSVQHQIYRATPSGGLVGLKTDYILPQPNARMERQTASIARARAADLQNLLYKHPVLAHFTLKIPRLQDIASLSPEEEIYVEHFLMAPVQAASQPAVTPQSVQEYQHYMVRVTLQAPGSTKPIHLLFNCYAKEMYIAYGKADLPGIPLEPISQKPGIR